jgi:ubiquinone/menaquinone biosynthesis C-methylase UbiE
MTTFTAPHTVSRDPYARISQLDESTVAGLAGRLELRASDGRQRRLWDEFLARATYPAGSTVLEVGCGIGTITELIAARPGVTHAVGVDPSPYLVEQARRRAPSLRFEVADGRSLPFDDRSLDGVVFCTTLCHIPGPELALAEAFRVLKPGGCLLAYDGDYATSTVALHPQDPLQACVEAAITRLVHDPWLVRRLVPLAVAAGFARGELRSHGYLELDSPAYMASLVAVGANALTETGALYPLTADALMAEATERASTNRFFGHIAYASLLTQRPT